MERGGFPTLLVRKPTRSAKANGVSMTDDDSSAADGGWRMADNQDGMTDTKNPEPELGVSKSGRTKRI